MPWWNVQPRTAGARAALLLWMDRSALPAVVAADAGPPEEIEGAPGPGYRFWHEGIGASPVTPEAGRSSSRRHDHLSCHLGLWAQARVYWNGWIA